MAKRRSGSVTGGFGFSFGWEWSSASAVPSDETGEIVAVGAVGAKIFLVEQALDAAAEANLVGIILSANRPTHPAMPTSAHHDHAETGQTGSKQPQRPPPSRLLDFFTHPPQPS